MIPIIQQGLHSLALGQRGPAEDTPDAPGFLAALAARDGSPTTQTPAISAEACLAAGMVVPAQPVLQSRPISMQEATALSTEVSPPELTSATNATPNVAHFCATPLALMSVDQAQPAATPIPAQAIDPPKDQPAAVSQAETTPTRLRIAAKAAQFQALPHHALPNQPLDYPAAPQQILPIQPLPVQPLPKQTSPEQTSPEQTLPEQTLPVQTPADQTPPHQTPPCESQDAPASPLPQQHATNISHAESAWQTRLQLTLPLRALPPPAMVTDRVLVDAGSSKTESPPTPTASPTSGSIELKPFMPPTPLANVALVPPLADIATQQVPPADKTPAHQAAAPIFAERASGMAPKPIPDGAATPVPPAALSDQTTSQPAPDQAAPSVNQMSLQPLPPHQTVQTQGLPAALAAAVPAQLLHHAPAAKTGGIDVLLQPEELGHVRFQIQQHGETVRILLSAERPETLDLLRRHSDQLLQEFRLSGFSQASLNFGQWGQQQRSPTPPPELATLFDADRLEAPTTPRHSPTPAAASSGQGLNIRL